MPIGQAARAGIGVRLVADQWLAAEHGHPNERMWIVKHHALLGHLGIALAGNIVPADVTDGIHPQARRSARPVFDLAHHAKVTVGQRQHFLQQHLESRLGRGAGNKQLLCSCNRLQEPVLTCLQHLPGLQRTARVATRQDFVHLGRQGQQVLLGSILHHEVSKPMAQGQCRMRLLALRDEDQGGRVL